MKISMVFFLMCMCSQAQEYNIWHFGGLAGLDFNQGAPTAIAGGKTLTIEGTASISDENGNLLFYTDGVRVWNKNHAVMQNGTGLNGHYSSTQSALIIPKPGSLTVYYIFTTTAVAGPNGLCYSVVDMEGAAGLGSVIEKNILLHTPTCEKLAASWHINGTDIWVMSHEYGNNVFAAYLVTAAGVNNVAVTSASGVVIADNSNPGAGHLKFSPNGKRLVMTSTANTTQLFDFNQSTGMVQNPVSLSESNHGVEFSASGNILYLTATGPLKSLSQYNLQATNIMATATELLPANVSEPNIGALQRGPDNKIYIARYQAYSLSVINQPDIPGTGCGFTDNGISLLNGTMVSSQHGLPNNSLSSAYRVMINRQLSCVGQESSFWVTSPQALPDTVLWEFGDGSSATVPNVSHAYLLPGSYTVRLTVTRQGVTRVVESVIEIINTVQVNQPAQMTSCEENGGSAHFELETQNASIIGNQNPDDFIITYHATIEHAEAGSYSLTPNYSNTVNPQTVYARVENINSGCYATTFFELIVVPKPVIDMPERYAVCEGSSVTLTAPAGFETYLWSTGQTTPAITVNEPGTYTVTVTESNNGMFCENSKTITVYRPEAPVITNVQISEWTVNRNSITVTGSGNGDYEYSIDGLNYQGSPEFYGLESGIYTVYVRNKNGCGADSRNVTLLMFPKFFTPNGDGVNDTWRINYSWKVLGFIIHIFDRYGRHITSLKGNSPGWDGTFNGQALPATDYWFTVERKDRPEYKGHFSMIR